MAKSRQLLLERLPDVYAQLLTAGVVEASLATQMPPSLSDRSTWPRDEGMAMLMTRPFDHGLGAAARNTRAARRHRALRGRCELSGSLRTPPNSPT